MLDEVAVRRLRDLKSRGMLKVRQEAMFYGVGSESIRRAVRGDTWTGLSMSPQEADLEGAVEASLAKLQRMLAEEKERVAMPDRVVAELAGLKGEHDAGY